MRKSLMIAFLSILITFPTQIQTLDQPITITTTTRFYGGVFVGPSFQYGQISPLFEGANVRIIERTRAGNWVYMQRLGDEGNVVLEGWIQTGILTYNPDSPYDLSDLPITDVLDADLRLPFSGRTERKLYETPILSPLSPTLKDVFTHGQTLGNLSNAFTKIGDSLIEDVTYLNIMSNPDYALGIYQHLEDTIVWFGDSAGESIAAQIGMTSYTLFDPMWADRTVCNAGESPLDCEIRLKKPSVAFVLFGQNDVRHMTFEQFETQLTTIVEYLLNQGVIPVLSTFSLHPDDQFLPQGMAFNGRIIDVATRYDVPLINLWAAARILPDYGLDQDLIHMRRSGYTALKFDRGEEMMHGISLQNLLALSLLDLLRRELEMDQQ